MGREDDVTQDFSPGGWNYSTRGTGDERGVWGGKDAQATGWEDVPGMPGQTRTTFSKSARQEDVDRYRDMGAAANTRPAYQLNYGAANENLGYARDAYSAAGVHQLNAGDARRDQNEALALHKSAAMGAQPSRAEILGRGLIDQSLKAQVAGAASARGGPLAQMAAQRNAAQGAAGFQQQGTNQLSALRADEMERARAGYTSAATGIRGQDYQGSAEARGQGAGFAGIAGQQAQQEQAQGQLDFNQRQLNQQGQLNYEQLGWNTNNAALGAGLARSGMDQANYWNRITNERADEEIAQRDRAAAVQGGSTIGGALINKSDVRAKKPAPLLLDMAGGRQPKAAAPNWLDQYMGGDGDHHQKAREEHDSRLEQVDAPNIYSRENPYDGPTPGGITRQDPYSTVINPETGAEEQDSNAEVYFSDERAKKEAFEAGAQTAAKHYTGEDITWGEDGPVDVGGPEAGPAPSGPNPLPPPGAHTDTGPVQFKPGPKPEPKGEPRPASIPAFHEKRPAAGRVPSGPVGEPSVGFSAQRPGAAPHRATTGATHKPPSRQHSGPISQIQQDANRKLQGMPWTYKDEHRPSTDAPGQLHYGGMAQNYEQNPITATAVRPGPDGMKAVDMASMQQVQGSGIASLQEQIDELRGGRRG
jgi:hypothetical protein